MMNTPTKQALPTQANPWQLLHHQAAELTAQAYQAGASALRIWSDQHLTAYWMLDSTTAERIQAIGQRYPQAKRLVLEGLELLSQSEPYWLEGNGLRVCWRMEI